MKFFFIIKSFDSKVFRISTNIPLNVNKLIKASKKKSNNNNNNNNETLSFSNELIYNRNLSTKSLSLRNNKNIKGINSIYKIEIEN